MINNGVKILSEQIIYTSQSYSYIIWIILFFLSVFFLVMGFNCLLDKWAIIAGTVSLILSFTIVGCSCIPDSPNIFNHPFKIRYEIEIINDNAWKEIGPNYNVLKKRYESKEIYIIEGDYVNDNT